MLLTAGQIMGETVSAEGREQGFPSMWSGLQQKETQTAAEVGALLLEILGSLTCTSYCENRGSLLGALSLINKRI